MKKHILAIAATTLFLASTSAWAWNDVSGTIKTIDADAHQITLDNGKTYVAQDGVDLASLKAGDTVTVSTEVQHGKNVVNKITKNS